MIDDNETPVGVGANAGVKRGLPSTGLDDAAKSADSLWQVARLGLTQKQAFAAKLGRQSASGGVWDRLTAQMRGFGLIKIEGDQIGLTELGQQLVNGSDPVKQQIARRNALLKLKAYRELVTSFDGTAAPDVKTLASRLKFEYGKSDDFATKAAEAFIASLKFAGMLDQHGKVQKAGAGDSAAAQNADGIADEHEAAEPEEDAGSGDSDEHTADDPSADASDDASGSDLASDSQKGRRVQRTSPSSQSGVTFAVSIDLSNFRADEVLEILKALPK